MMMRAAALCGVALVSGCAGPMFEGTIFEQPPSKDPDVARIATNTQQMGVEFRQVSEQINALTRSQEMLDARLSKVESQMSVSPRAQDDLAELRRDVQSVRAERETLKKEITEDLAGRIEKIAARQQADINAARTAATSSAGTASAARPSAGTAGAARPSGGTAAPGKGGYEHKVERGQTLSVIARGYNKSVESIMKANKISNPSALRVGQVLFIPD